VNQIKRKLLFALFSLIFILSSCESPEDRFFRESMKEADKNLNALEKDMDNSVRNMVAMQCQTNCNSFKEDYGDSYAQDCYKSCVSYCGSSLGCANRFVQDHFTPGYKIIPINDEENNLNIVKSESTWEPPPEKANYFKNTCIYRCSENLQNLVKNGITKEKLDEAFQKEYERISIIFKSNETCQCTEKDEQGKEIVKEVLLFPSK